MLVNLCELIMKQTRFLILCRVRLILELGALRNSRRRHGRLGQLGALGSDLLGSRLAVALALALLTLGPRRPQSIDGLQIQLEASQSQAENVRVLVILDGRRRGCL